MTYLELVNDVLTRLRETNVSTVSETNYSALIGKFINDAKRQIEDSYNWNVLTTTISFSTVANTHNYSLIGSGQKFQVNDAINKSQSLTLKNVSFVMMNHNLNFASPAKSVPSQYAFVGVDSNGDTTLELYPIPDNVYTIIFTLAVPQAALTSDSTSVKVLDYLVTQSAYARALIERGEDGGTASSEAYALFKGMLSDAIALESTRYVENNFVPV